MTGAVVLNMVVVFVVMLPTLFNFYTNPGMNMLLGFSFLQIMHGAVAFPAISMALIFALRDLPTQTKKWMRITGILWVTSIELGAIVYFTMPK